jgi:stage II sporulation protein GA (sporulation sigma-E factor processing peptidase)
MVVYLDMLLLQNFFVNIFLLTITLQTIKKKCKILKLVMGAFVGSLYVIAMLYPKYAIFTTTPFKILVAMVMILITTAQKNFLLNLKATIIFIFYSMLLAGVAFYSALSDMPTLSPNTVVYNFNNKNTFIGIMVIYVFIHRIVTYIKDRKKLNSFVYSVDIYTKGIKTSLKAFLDTGNELREPATNLPVIIIEKEYFNKIDLEGYSIYHIPYSVVNGYNGKLIGIKPDNIKITFDDITKDENAIIAFCDKKLSKNNDYNGLLPRGILE